ncbi:universal stress protein [Methanobacterium oryzae]|uniref:universal stress protein n=1 Tax=Methanobacterium oryzae TaxID=69540 RepID=UPI003D1A9FB3
MYKKILLPTDGSESAERAAEHAFRFGSRVGAEIIVLNVIETPRFTGIRPTDEDELRSNLEQEGQKSFDRISDKLTGFRSGEKCEKEVRLTFKFKEGSPADTILKTIGEEGIELVVMGTSGKRGLDRFLLGSVAENTMRSAPCPVLVVR